MNPLNYIFRFITCAHLRLNFGGGSKSTSSQVTDASTKVQTTNEQVGASEGSIAVGANSTANITSVDKDVIAVTADAIQAAAGEGQVTARYAIAGQGQAVKDALHFGEESLGSVERTVRQANDILSRSFEGYSAKIANNAGEAPSAAANTSLQTVVVGAVFLFGLMFFFRGNSNN